jgi:hypothetical protein
MVGMIETVRRDNIHHICGRPQDRAEPRIADRCLKIGNEIGIGVDHDQHAIAPQPFEHRTAKCADARPIFDKHPAIAPIDR